MALSGDLGALSHDLGASLAAILMICFSTIMIAQILSLYLKRIHFVVSLFF
jgi:hypothetical protein